MIDSFPYPNLSKEQITGKINCLASLRTPFLFIIDYKGDQGYVITQDEMDPDTIRFMFESLHSTPETRNAEHETQNAEHKTLTWNFQPVSIEEYQPKFEYVQNQIHLGNSFLVNLTQPTVINTNLTLLELYNNSRAKYKLWIKDSMLVLSPETFVRIEGRILSSFPMKGTIDAAIPNAEQIILNDPKEMAEHATIVDLIRNDLSLVAEKVEVKRYRYVEKIRTNKQDLLQVSSEITGLLPDDYRDRLGDVLFELLPAGSICGAPKAKTLEIIHEVEGYERGFYTGICGFFDGDNLDTGVMIRYLEQNEGGIVFKSGGGITAQSEMIKEYEEIIQKVYVPVF